MDAISRLPADRPIVTLVGEIDCGYLIWSRAAARATSPEAELRRSVRSYLDLLDEVEHEGHANLIVCAVPYPTLETYSNERRSVTATLEERMNITSAFNDQLRGWCDRHGARYLSYDCVLDHQTRRVRSEFHHRDSFDHHYRTAALGPVIANELHNMGFR